MDEWLGRIVAKLKDLGIYECTRIYVTSDHGMDEGKTSHAMAPYVSLATNDPGIKARSDQRT
ncbi:MAG: alkaline phosphatase family protein [Firmicutes bacterium]|nr:alkaline phosphatase family protein [Bacillota bacterium]